LLSRSGIIPISHTQDTPGPMARTVRDAAILLGELTGVDPRDASTVASKTRASIDYTRHLDPGGLRNARIGVARNYFGFNEAIDALMGNVLEEMRRQGAVIVDATDLGTNGRLAENEMTVLLHELKADLNNYLTSRGPGTPVRSLKEIIEFNERNKEREMPYFGQDLLIKAEAAGPLSSKEYLYALRANIRLARKEGIDATINKYKLDAIVAPTGSPAWVTDLVNGDHFTGGCSTAAAVAGYPHITVPAGFIFGLPAGISFFGRAWSEPKLLQLAYSFEQATMVRKAPQFLPSVRF